MVSSRIILICTLVAVLLGACEESVVETASLRPDFREGQWWMYLWEVSLVDSSGVESYGETDSVLVQVISTSAELDSLTGLICVQATSLKMPSAGIERVWYTHTTESLVEVAYLNPTAVPVVHMRIRGNRFADRRFSILDPTLRWSESPVIDSIQMREDPRVVLQYPLTPGSDWTAFTRPFLETRRVTGIGEKDLPDGRSVQIVSISTVPSLFGPEDNWIDEVSDAGMLGRSMKIHIEVFDQNMNPAGTSIHTETLTLIGMAG